MSKKVLFLIISLILHTQSYDFQRNHIHSNLRELYQKSLSNRFAANKAFGCHRHSHIADGHVFTHCHG